jgi:hypothetical protein
LFQKHKVTNMYRFIINILQHFLDVFSAKGPFTLT